ncbi:MAG: DUF1523 family protein [Nanoarchaeota archaeon]|nr:DUF1523 family protein [Nanoarchaeota archaeon]
MGFKAKALGTLILVGLGYASIPHLDRETHRLTVVKTERTSGEDGKYLVFGERPDGSTRVLENTDSPLELKWNSSDIYTKIVPGKTYDFRTYGFRIPFFSAYENILEAIPVSTDTTTR